MKVFKRFTSILFVAATMTMAACDPDEIVSPDPEHPADPISDVYHTAWINEQTDTYEDEYGNQHESVETNIVRFETEKSGHMEYKYVTATQNENESYPFTYTYSTPNGTFTISEGGETETFNFSYNASNNTLALYGSEGYYMMFSRLQE